MCRCTDAGQAAQGVARSGLPRVAPVQDGSACPSEAGLRLARSRDWMRALAAARAIVQRNIDTALTLAWTSTSEPAILQLTNGLQDYDDDGALGNSSPNNVAIVTQQTDSSAAGPLLGRLRRSVTDVSAGGAQLRQVTIQLDYTYGSRPYSVQMMTERAIDD